MAAETEGMSSIEEQIEQAINDRVEAQGTTPGHSEDRRVGNSRFFWNDGVGGLARIKHDELPLAVDLRPREVSVWSRVPDLEIEVDHDPDEENRLDINPPDHGEGFTHVDHGDENPQVPPEDEDDIYAQVPGEDAMEGVESKEDLTRPAKKVVEHIDMNHLRDRLEGRGGGLRSSKPTAQGDTGFEQYVWRMARFHSGDDPKIPVTASWWLQDWMEDEGIDASVSGVMDEEGKQIVAILNVVAKLIVRSFGRNPQGGLERWQRALFG